MTKLHVFDLDHTLVQRNLSFQFGLYLYKKKALSLPSLLYCMLYYYRHTLFSMSLQKLHEKIFGQIFRGWFLSSINRYLEAFLDTHLNELLNPTVYARMKSAQERGEVTAIMSNGADFIVSAIARRLKVSEWRATRYEVDEKKRLAKLGRLMDGRAKAQATLELAAQLGILPSDTVAYTDSIHDLPLLEIAGKAVVVGPDRKLRRVCRERHWDILE
jgi:HAD superfamily hydrolase (TIGR01490 family)